MGCGKGKGLLHELQGENVAPEQSCSFAVGRAMLCGAPSLSTYWLKICNTVSQCVQQTKQGSICRSIAALG